MIDDRPDLSSGRAPHRQDSNFQTTTFGQEVISGHKSESGLDTSTYWLTSAVTWLRLQRSCFICRGYTKSRSASHYTATFRATSICTAVQKRVNSFALNSRKHKLIRYEVDDKSAIMRHKRTSLVESKTVRPFFAQNGRNAEGTACNRELISA
jgi:hypothetical protein